MKIEDLVQEAKDFGFTNAISIDVKTMTFLPEVRDMCSVNVCKQYDTNWTCPPACGTLEECAERAAKYSQGFIVQTTGTLDDPFDFEGMIALQREQQERLLEFTPILQARGIDLLALGTEACIVCESCTYPDAPCCYPALAFPPMEAFGLFVSDLCAKNNIPYFYGEGTLTYVALYLLNL